MDLITFLVVVLMPLSTRLEKNITPLQALKRRNNSHSVRDPNNIPLGFASRLRVN